MLAPPEARVAMPELDGLEQASGVVLGRRRDGRRELTLDAANSPREVLERLLLPALERTPCLVAFSGGRDSSSVLAVAVDVARRHGLDDPVPITFRYGGDRRTHEDEWQAAVVRHLGLPTREVLSYTGEADALGAPAAETLRRHGQYWPSGLHVTVPLMEAARGGSLVTGVGGDELFSPWEHRRVALVRGGRLRPGGGDLGPLALALAPPALRSAVWRLRHPMRLGWLTDEGNRRLAARYAEHRNGYLRRTWADSARAYVNGRYVEVTHGSFLAIAAASDVLGVEPFMDPELVDAVVSRAPVEGFASRQAALSGLVEDLLPPEFLARSTKAVFTDVFWGPASRAFARDWDGRGLDPALVAPEALRAEWAKPRPDFRSVSALHAAWLAAPRSRRISYSDDSPLTGNLERSPAGDTSKEIQ